MCQRQSCSFIEIYETLWREWKWNAVGANFFWAEAFAAYFRQCWIFLNRMAPSSNFVSGRIKESSYWTVKIFIERQTQLSTRCTELYSVQFCLVLPKPNVYIILHLLYNVQDGHFKVQASIYCSLQISFTALKYLKSYMSQVKEMFC